MKALKSHGTLRISVGGWSRERMNPWKRWMWRTWGSWISNDQLIHIFLTNPPISQTNNTSEEGPGIYQTSALPAVRPYLCIGKWSGKGGDEGVGLNQSHSLLWTAERWPPDPGLILRVYFPPDTIFEKLIIHSRLPCRFICMRHSASVNLLNVAVNWQSVSLTQKRGTH